jgi:hypothetical protein
VRKWVVFIFGLDQVDEAHPVWELEGRIAEPGGRLAVELVVASRTSSTLVAA